MVSVGRGPGSTAATTGANKPAKSSGKSWLDQLGLGATEQGKRGGLGGIIDGSIFSSRNTGSDPASVKARKTEEDRVATATTAWRKKNNTLYHGPKGGASIGDAPKDVPPSVAPAPGKRPPRTVKRTTTTVMPTERPQATVATSRPKQTSVRAVQSWRGGDVPGQIRYDPGTKPNPTKKQRVRGGGVHDTKGLKWFKGSD